MMVSGRALQRKCACGQHTSSDGECEECKQKRGGALQRAAVNPLSASDVPPVVHEVLRSSGQPLDASTRAFMEPRFGHDFSGVRVHTDTQAAESARAVNALAYTVGRDVVFGEQRYSPQTLAGQRLLAHELTHVVQQGAASAPTAANLRIGHADDPLEREASTLAQETVSDESLRSQQLSRTEAILSRQEGRAGARAAITPELTIVLEDLNTVQPSRAVVDTIRQAIEPLARRAGRTLQFGRHAPGDLTLSFDPGGRESRPCGILILGNEGGGDIFVGAHKDLRVCGGPQRDPERPGEIDYVSQIERVFDEEEEAFGRFVGNTAVHELGHLMAQLDHTSGPSNYMHSQGALGANLPREMRTRANMRRHWAGRKNFTADQARTLTEAIRTGRFTGGMRIEGLP
jgi:hypothetical protein